jgi:hypothetical protein
MVRLLVALCNFAVTTNGMARGFPWQYDRQATRRREQAQLDALRFDAADTLLTFENSAIRMTDSPCCERRCTI